MKSIFDDLKNEITYKYFVEEKSIREISKELNIHSSTVYYNLKKCGYKLRDISDTKKGKLNPQWKGDNVGFNSLHEWIANHKPKPKLCERCNKLKPYDLANISGEYKRDINDFEWLCRKCHMESDGGLKNLIKRNKESKPNWKGGITKDFKKYLKEYKKNNKDKINKLGRSYYWKNKNKISKRRKELYNEKRRINI